MINNRLKIAILGATGHIAKGLVENFITNTNHQLFLYSRSIDSFKNYPVKLPQKRATTLMNDSFKQYRYDAIVNCVGVGDPQKVKESGGRIFLITEEFDQLVMNYLYEYPKCKYINFSSGAVYGKELNGIVSLESEFKLAVNNISDKDYYAIAKLNSEAKHRSFGELNIIDIRVFSYFSRYINLKTKYLITEILDSILHGKTFVTDSNDIVRDYIGPKDLFNLVDHCLKYPNHLNLAIDVYSKEPVKKTQILKFFTSNFQLKWRVESGLKILNATGMKSQYYSTNKTAEIVGYKPASTSLEILGGEAKCILKKRKQ